MTTKISMKELIDERKASVSLWDTFKKEQEAVNASTKILHEFYMAITSLSSLDSCRILKGEEVNDKFKGSLWAIFQLPKDIVVLEVAVSASEFSCINCGNHKEYITAFLYFEKEVVK